MNNKAFIMSLKLVLAGSMMAFLSGCGEANSETTSDAIKPVKLYQVPDIARSDFDLFLAEVDAGNRSQLSFRVPGVVEKLTVKEGQKVKQGDMLATLDAKDYQLALDASQAQYDLVNTRYLRNKQLFEKNLISADAYDQAETSFKAADANLEQAKTDLQYTQIKAPFDGIVSLKFVQSYQFVSAKQPVLNIINNEHLDINMVLPVPYVEKTGIHSLSNRQYAVVFDIHSSLIIPASFKEMSTQPNTDTNSYSATVSIIKPKSLNILTGMTGQVLIANDRKENVLSFPDDAWISKNTNEGKLWIFSQETEMIQAVSVQLNEFGAVTSGLSAGDMVVVAGASNLVEGQTVRAWTREGGI